MSSVDASELCCTKLEGGPCTECYVSALMSDASDYMILRYLMRAIYLETLDVASRDEILMVELIRVLDVLSCLAEGKGPRSLIQEYGMADEDMGNWLVEHEHE